MFKRIQQLKIAELKQQIAKIRNQQHILNNPVDELQDQIYALEKLIKRGNSAYKGKQKFNFFEKNAKKQLTKVFLFSIIIKLFDGEASLKPLFQLYRGVEQLGSSPGS